MKNKRVLLLVSVLALMLCVWWWHNAALVSSSSARVQAYSLVISPRFDGYVVDVPVKEGDRVKTGQLLLRMDSAALETALAREEAKLTVLGVNLPRVPQSTPENKSNDLDQARRDENAARQEVERLSTFQAATSFELARLRARGAGAKDIGIAAGNDNAARSAFANAKERLEAASKTRARLEQQTLAARNAGPAGEAHAALYAAQEAVVRQARQELEATFLKAPADGVVLSRAAGPGVMLQRGQSALTLLPSGPDHVWVSATFPKAAAKRLRPGQDCTILVEGYSGPELSGIIGGILPAAPAQESAPGPDAEAVRVHVTLTSYNPDVMPLLPVNEKARVTVQTRQAAAKSGNGSARSGANASRL